MRAIGLGVVMALATMALPSGALATGGIEADGYPAYVVSPETGSWTQEFVALSATNSCSTVDEATLNPTRVAMLSTTSKLNCNRKTAMNGCKFRFLAGSQNLVEIGPAGCGPMTYELPTCTLQVPPQSFPATFTNVGSGSTGEVSASVGSNFNYVQKKVGGQTCKDGVAGAGTYIGKWKFKATNEAKTQIGLRANDKFPVGLFVEGEESAEESKQPEFATDSSLPLPVAVEGTEKATHEIKSQEWSKGTLLTCSWSSFSGVLPLGSSQVDLSATYKTEADYCNGLYGHARVIMNSCTWDVRLLNAGPPYTGEADIDCAEGDVMEIRISAFMGLTCVAEIPEQSGFTGVSLTNTGEGNGRKVTVGFSLTGIEAEIVANPFELICGKEIKVGTVFKDLAYTGSISIGGYE